MNSSSSSTILSDDIEMLEETPHNRPMDLSISKSSILLASTTAFSKLLPLFATNPTLFYYHLYQQQQQQQQQQQRERQSFLKNENKFTSETMRNYLKERNDQTIVILNAKVAQKSYGNEKRFFCPPPCVYLQGTLFKRDDLNLKTFIGIGNSERELQALQFDSERFAAAKTMFISDSDKRKHFKLLFRLHITNEHKNNDTQSSSGGGDDGGGGGEMNELGSFLSQSIKVISKPSKKKQSIKNSDLCIASSSKIALFNRLRSQTISTRYLYCESGVFYASAHKWGSFQIYLIDDTQASDEEKDVEREEFLVKEGFIHYGSTIKLVCTQTGLALPRLVIRKVDKSQVILDARDAVSQLHKCAFYLKDSLDMYLCLSQEKIIQYQAIECPLNRNRQILNDAACWTIISTDETKYTWCDTMHQSYTPSTCLTSTRMPITPVPTIKSIKNVQSDYVEIKGDDLTQLHEIWFDEVKCNSLFICSNLIKCEVPSINLFLQNDYHYSNSKRQQTYLKVSILIVRPQDGIIYNTGLYYTYFINS